MLFAMIGFPQSADEMVERAALCVYVIPTRGDPIVWL